MKICRYEDAEGGPIKIGLVEGDTVYDVTAASERLPVQRWPYPPGDLFITHLAELRPVIADLAWTAIAVPLDRVRLKAPIANPGKFLCGVGNHKIVLEKGSHLRDLGLLFR